MITVEFNPWDISKIKNALRGLEVIVQQESQDTPRAFAVSFAEDFRQAIYQQRYLASWSTRKYNKKYEKWKKKHFGSLDFWKLRSDLIMSTSFWSRSPKDWSAGIPKGVSGKHGSGAEGKYIGAYAYYNEFGWRSQSGKISGKRELLQPTFRDFTGRQMIYRETMIVNRVHRVWRDK